MQTCSKVKTKEARAVFDACVAIVRKEAGTAQFLLPHVVLAVLTSGGKSIKIGLPRRPIPC